jgi:hypothetical protein
MRAILVRRRSVRELPPLQPRQTCGAVDVFVAMLFKVSVQVAETSVQRGDLSS